MHKAAGILTQMKDFNILDKVENSGASQPEINLAVQDQGQDNTVEEMKRHG